jgi:phosphopantothenoylcysteine decarboxylase/phosphopantothenate--cysteine ligase
MTRGAREFVGPLTFQAVSGRRVRDDLWDADAEAAMGHIELARWADVVLVAPATAHFLGTLAGGLGGDLLATVCLATTAPIVLAPAMNQAMWANAAVQANRARWRLRRAVLPGRAIKRAVRRGLGAARALDITPHY